MIANLIFERIPLANALRGYPAIPDTDSILADEIQPGRTSVTKSRTARYKHFPTDTAEILERAEQVRIGHG